MRLLLAFWAYLYTEALRRRRKEDLLALAEALADHPAAKIFFQHARSL